MDYFSIKDIESLSGIKAHTLRIWEQRYRIFVPKRKGSTHRVYDNDDLKQLLRISFLYHNGWKISKIARLSKDAILNEVKKTGIGIGNGNYSGYISQLLEAAIEFNNTFFVLLLDQIITKIGFEKCITEVCYPYLQRIGMLWVTNNVIPAQEHFSSYIIQNKIIAETDKLDPVNTPPRLILFSPTGEFHELPLLFIHYLLKKNKWSVVYLGQNIQKEELQQFINIREVTYLFLHLITNFTGMDAGKYIEDLCRTFSNKTIIVSGTIVHEVRQNFSNLKLLNSCTEIYEFIEKPEVGKKSGAGSRKSEDESL